MSATIVLWPVALHYTLFIVLFLHTGTSAIQLIRTVQRKGYISHRNFHKLYRQPSTMASNTVTSSTSSSTTDGPSSTTTNGTTNTSTTSTASRRGIAHQLARSNILELQPYRCARDDYSKGILLDANENSYGPPDSVRPTTKATRQPSVQSQTNQSDGSTTKEVSTMELERYPDPYQIPLKEQFIQFRGYNNKNNSNNAGCTTATTPPTQRQPSNVRAENVFVGVGSDEAIDLLMRIFCTPNTDAILITPPTYGMYKVCAKINDCQVVTVPLTPQFDVQIDQVTFCSL
jgi:Aminotransferase class I and II